MHGDIRMEISAWTTLGRHNDLDFSDLFDEYPRIKGAVKTIISVASPLFPQIEPFCVASPL